MNVTKFQLETNEQLFMKGSILLKYLCGIITETNLYWLGNRLIPNLDTSAPTLSWNENTVAFFQFILFYTCSDSPCMSNRLRKYTASVPQSTQFPLPSVVMTLTWIRAIQALKTKNATATGRVTAESSPRRPIKFAPFVMIWIQRNRNKDVSGPQSASLFFIHPWV